MVEHPTTAVIRAALLVTADPAASLWTVYARLTDTPEAPVIDCGPYTVRR